MTVLQVAYEIGLILEKPDIRDEFDSAFLPGFMQSLNIVNQHKFGVLPYSKLLRTLIRISHL